MPRPDRFIHGYHDPKSVVEIGLKLEGVPADPTGTYGKQTVADQKELFACNVIDEPSYEERRALRAGDKTYSVNIEFDTQLSPAQEKAINDKNVLKKLTYIEAAKLSGTDKPQVYYQIEIGGIQNASAHNSNLRIFEAESMEVKYKIAKGAGEWGAQEVISVTPKS